MQTNNKHLAIMFDESLRITYKRLEMGYFLTVINGNILIKATLPDPTTAIFEKTTEIHLTTTSIDILQFSTMT